VSGGRVHLVGAGPGDPRLLTLRARDLLAQADVILYDRLGPSEALDHAREGAELIYVGKEGGGEAVPQERTVTLMVEHARAGKRVVRLKGGDPFVFGRGGEEAIALRNEGIPFEVVPGVTAGVAAPAAAGIPVTHRDVASAVAFVTGHEDPEKASIGLDWDALAAFPGTLVLYMGLRALPAITRRLLTAGRRADEPAAVIEGGTLPGQRVVEGTLTDIAERATAAGVKAPALTVIGDVTSLRGLIADAADRPLDGKTVVVTRARAQASELSVRLRALGATVVEAPAIRIVPLDGNAPDLGEYDLVCLTSANGVELLFERLAADGQDARAFADATVAAIGPGTARALRAHGIEADIVPKRFVAEGLVEALRDVPVTRALVARAKDARDVLPDALRERGAAVDVVALYETVAEPVDGATLEAARAADYVTFTSSSTVRFFLATSAAREAVANARAVSIGPVTSESLREHGIEPAVEAQDHDIDGVVEALLAALENS
jgi:uroporphyrinogen III methyltransferase/synthase